MSGLSPDGKWAVTIRVPERRRIELVPTGAGEPRAIDLENLTAQWVNWLKDGKRLVLMASEPGRGSRLFVLDPDGGKPVAITPEGVSIVGQAVSPDGKSLVARGPDGRLAIYPVEPGEPQPIPGQDSGSYPLRFTADGRSLYVTRMSAPPGIIDLVDIATGKRTPWKSFEPPDPSGVEVVGPAVISEDGRSYVYSYRRTLDELFLATGMR